MVDLGAQETGDAMMLILDTFTVKGRGLVLCVEPVGPRPVNGATLRRLSDGKAWMVAATEHNARGWNGGILVSGDATPVLAAGDEIELVP